MAPDFLFALLIGPMGLAFIAALIGFPFLIWRACLEARYPQIGATPFAVGYLAMFAGLLAISFSMACLEFSERGLEESERWPTVVGWTVYVCVISLPFLLPLIGFMAVPLAAYLAKHAKLTYGRILAITMLVCLLLVTAIWVSPDNEWESTHRTEAFLKDFYDYGLHVGGVILFFLAGVRISIGSRSAPV